MQGCELFDMYHVYVVRYRHLNNFVYFELVVFYFIGCFVNYLLPPAGKPLPLILRQIKCWEYNYRWDRN
jgi:hypothetical protein